MQTARSVAIWLAAAAVVSCGTSGATRGRAQGPVDDDIVDAVGEIHQMSSLLGEAGKMGQKLGSSDEVRDFGRTLERDHRAIDDRMEETADRLGIDLERIEASGSYKEQLAEIRKMSRLRGEEFDREFLRGMVETYDDLITDVEDTARNIQDVDTRRDVLDLVPKLREHQAQARVLSES